MPPVSKSKPRASNSRQSKSKPKKAESTASISSNSSSNALPSSGYLLTCDPPAKQFIKRLDDTKSIEKKFILQDLDATHLLIVNDTKVREEILKRVEEWMDENVFSNIERVGEQLET